MARRTEVVRRHISITMDKIGKVETLLTYIQRVDEDAVQEDFQRLADGTGMLTVSVHPDRQPCSPTWWRAHKLVADVEVLKAIHTPPTTDSPRQP